VLPPLVVVVAPSVVVVPATVVVVSPALVVVPPVSAGLQAVTNMANAAIGASHIVRLRINSFLLLLSARGGHSLLAGSFIEPVLPCPGASPIRDRIGQTASVNGVGLLGSINGACLAIYSAARAIGHRHRNHPSSSGIVPPTYLRRAQDVDCKRLHRKDVNGYMSYFSRPHTPLRPAQDIVDELLAATLGAAPREKQGTHQCHVVPDSQMTRI
jgi:hypothetical protein